MSCVAGPLCRLLWPLREKIKQASLNTHPGKWQLVTSTELVDMASSELFLLLFTCPHSPACRQRKSCQWFQVKGAVTVYKALRVISWNTLVLCHPESKPIGTCWRCLEEELLSTSSQRCEVYFRSFRQGTLGFCYFNIRSLLSMGFVTWITEG